MLKEYGDLSLNDINNRVAIIGSRDIDENLKTLTFELAKQLAQQGVSIVSGYANGIDEYGHLGCIQGGGKTVAVLAEGIANFRWKKSFKELEMSKQQLSQQILFVTKYEDNAIWKSYRAMERNQIIIDLSEVIVIMSMGEKGGTLDSFQKAYKSKKTIIFLDIPLHKRIVDMVTTHQTDNMFDTNQTLIYFASDITQIMKIILEKINKEHSQIVAPYLVNSQRV